MKKPTLEEVKEHFKDALEVKDYSNSRVSINKLDKIFLGVFDNYLYDKNSHNFTYLWCKDYGYAEITKYKDYTTRNSKGLKNPNAKHYELWNDFEAIDVIKASLTPEEYKGYLKGNVLKYKLRDKGQDESDKVKIKDYQNELNNN